MFEQNASPCEPPVASRSYTAMTTYLAISWGVLAAFMMSHFVLGERDLRSFLATLIPLIAVWGTLERKRWGRLALLGLSKSVLLLFLYAVILVVTIGSDVLPPTNRNPVNYIQMTLNLVAYHPVAALSMLMLAMMTRCWLSVRSVMDEFDHRLTRDGQRHQKSAFLTPGQYLIAGPLILLWFVAVFYTPLTPIGSEGSPARSAIEQVFAQCDPLNSLVRTFEHLFP